MTDQITEVAFDLRVYAEASELDKVVSRIEYLLEDLMSENRVIDFKYLADEDYLEGLDGELHAEN